MGTGEWEEEGGGEDWSGQWASADGMTTGLTKRERGGRWRLGNGKATAKGRELGDGDGQTANGRGEDDKSGRPRGEVETEVAWGRDVSQNCLLSLFVFFWV